MHREKDDLPNWAALKKVGECLKETIETRGPGTGWLYAGLASFAFEALHRAGYDPLHDSDRSATKLRLGTVIDALAERWRDGQPLDNAALDRIAGELGQLMAEFDEELAERQRESIAKEQLMMAADKASAWLRHKGLPTNDATAELAFALINANGGTWPRL